MSVKRNEIQKEPLKTCPNTVSKFTFKDLGLLEDPSIAYQLPLAVIAHVDMNAFFAQVEQIRLNLTVDDPVVCAQWQSLIAVSYAARKFGIGRMDTIQSAREKCPNIIIAHAAVFKKGESHWSYIKGLPNQSTHKVLLDPYRRESRKIMKIFREYCDLVEKASVDECFLDFGRMVYYRLKELFPELTENGDSNAQSLPSIPTVLPDCLSWIGQVVRSENESPNVDGNSITKEDFLPEIRDWDDICILIGSQLLYEVRLQVFKELGYTTSGGLGRNKIIAKIAGGFLKPDNQTIVRCCLTANFLKNFQLVDFNGMGGKIGEAILQRLEVPPDVNSISYIRTNFSLKEIHSEFKEDLSLAKRIYEMVRGDYKQELTLRTDIKSMMSRKNFVSRKPVNTLLDAYDWIKVFAGDLYNRLIELDDESLNLLMLQQTSRIKGYIRRPKTISIQISSTSYIKHSKQTQLTIIRSLEKLRENMEIAGTRLLMEILDNSTNVHQLNNGISLRELDKNSDKDYSKINIIPLANMSLVISNFVKNTDSSLIDSYAGNSSEATTGENIRKMFDEVEQESRIKRVKLEQQNPKMLKSETKSRSISKEDGDYLNKLFADFNAEQSEVLKTKRVATGPEPITQRDIYGEKQKKEHIRSLFHEFESNSNVQNSRSKSKKSDERKYDILQDLSSSNKQTRSNKSPCDDELFFNELVSKNFCSRCNRKLSDVFEHRDFHIALDLSLKINGNDSNFETTEDNCTSKKIVTSSKIDKGQSKLPF